MCVCDYMYKTIPLAESSPAAPYVYIYIYIYKYIAAAPPPCTVEILSLRNHARPILTVYIASVCARLVLSRARLLVADIKR